jgi:PAT family beta-lactamase induction signal transducer AmpG
VTPETTPVTGNQRTPRLRAVTEPSRFARWRDAAAIYADRRIVAIFFMGFSSGLPLLLVLPGATLGIWLRESGVDLTTIGIFALVGIAYSFKFVWAPIIDHVPVPWLTRRLGQRRSWALVAQVALIISIIMLGQTDPATDPGVTALWAVAVAFASASQDIVIDAFRIELLEDNEQGFGAAATQLGYRGGLVAAGAGALFAASYGGWDLAFRLMAGCVLVGMVTVLLTPEPQRRGKMVTAQQDGPVPFGQWLKIAVIEPFADFMKRDKWAVILVFILAYKVGDAVAGATAGPFYIDMGFSKDEIGWASKIFGVGATLAGIAIGGLMVYRLGIMKALMVAGILQMLSNLMFAAQAVIGHDFAFLFATIGIENLSSGMGAVAFVAYLSSLCNVAYTATQYALLTSLMAVPRSVIAASGGYFAETLGWTPFFVWTTVAAAPGLLILWWLMRRAPEAQPLAAGEPDH